LKIAVDARPLANPGNGIWRYTYHLLTRMQALSDHRWHLYGYEPSPEKNNQMRDTDTRLNALIPTRFASLSAQLQYPLWAAKDTIDIFWSPRHHLPLLPHIPSIVSIHDVLWKKEPDSMPRDKRLLESLLMPQALRRAHRVIAVSHSVSEELQNYFPFVSGKISTILEASSLASKQLQTTLKKGGYMLFVGTLEPRKNLLTLLEAYHRLQEVQRDAPKLVIAGGTGWKMPDLEQIAKNLGISHKVDFPGLADDDELSELYSHCDFLVFPSLYEGFGLPLVEAMSFGKPVITSNISSMPEVAGDAGLLVDPHSPGEIAEAMKKLITDRALHRRLSENALTQSAKFSWDRAAEETLAVLESAANSR